MRHRTGYKKLSKPTDQRKALLTGLAISLLKNGRLITSKDRAKEAVKVVEKVIALSKKGGSRKPEFSFEIGIKETGILKREENSPSESVYILTADGEDQIGLVAKVSAFCKEHKINILDLSTRADNERYTMILLLDMSSVKSLSGIRKALNGFSLKTGLNTELQHRDIFVATNEI